MLSSNALIGQEVQQFLISGQIFKERTLLIPWEFFQNFVGAEERHKCKLGEQQSEQSDKFEPPHVSQPHHKAMTSFRSDEVKYYGQ